MKGDKLHAHKLRSAPSKEQDEDIEEVNRFRDEEHDQIVEDLQLLRDYYKSVYKQALEGKVQLQRKQLRENRMKMLNEEQKVKEQQERQRHKISVRLPKSEVLNDDTFKRGMQQTEYYKIISLENQLRKEGFLEKLHDVKDFWEYITAAGNLEKVMEEGQLSWEDVKHHQHIEMALTKEQPQQKKKQRQNKKKVQFDNALSKEDTKADHWQSTVHGHRKLITPPSMSGTANNENGKESTTESVKLGSRKSSKTKLSSRATLMEQKFPKVDFPSLAAYRLEFGEREPDPEEVRKAEETKRRLNERETMRRTLNTMFSHARANRAATQRLIDRNKELSFDSVTGASSVHELLSHAEDYVIHTVAATKQKQLQQLPRREVGSHSTNKSPNREIHSAQLPRNKVGSHSTHKSPKREIHSAESSNSQTLTDYDESTAFTQNINMELPPLTLEQLGESCVKKEATGLSTLWTNPFS